MLFWVIALVGFILLLGTVGPWVFLMGLLYLAIIVGLLVSAAALVILLIAICLAIAKLRQVRREIAGK